MIFMAGIGMNSATLMNASAFDRSMDVVRNMVFEITGKQPVLQAAASAPFTEFATSGDLPDIINGLSSITGVETDKIKNLKLETFGQAANFVMERGGG